MKTTLRFKLFAIFGTALVALLAVLLVGAVMSVRQSRALDEVQGRLVPKAELGPRVEAEFERLSRGFQDAVAAQDTGALDAVAEHRAALFELITSAGPALEPAAVLATRGAVQEYYETARHVSQRLIAGESGDELLHEVARMQSQQRTAEALIKRSTGLDRQVLSDAFGNLRRDGASADRLRIGIASASVLAVALLAFWGGQGLIQALQGLSRGLDRFGTGDFKTPIRISTGDELAALAEQANRMAWSLLRHAEAREQDDWLKAGVAGLSEQLLGELEPVGVAERALRHLASRTGALAGALYLPDDDGTLVLKASYARTASDLAAVPRFAPGEGLVGQAARSDQLWVVSNVPAQYWKLRSGLGETTPTELVFLPLSHHGHGSGVLELALLSPLDERGRELLLAVRPHLVIAFDAARGSAARQALLRETQAQAGQLASQEEELRLNNQELLAQQEELRRANVELVAQRSALSRKNTELESAQVVLAEKAEELSRVSSYKSQFLANMSHELRTPLNSMLLLSQLLAENDGGNLAPKQVEHLRTIHGAGQDLLGLINEVLDLSKIESGKQDLRLDDVDVAHFASFARRLCDATAAQKGIELAIEVNAASPVHMLTDRQRLERILLNLLGNALKFTDRGRVSLAIGPASAEHAALVTGDAMEFVVSDTGIGIPADARERIFAPFEQVQGATNRGHPGTGLGLPIARESARLLGGDLVLEASSSRGSRFVCVVPTRTRSRASEGAPNPQVLEIRRADITEPHLLIVEDDTVLAEQLVEIAAARQLQAVVVDSGAECLELAKSGNTLGIVLDVKLPDLDGWTVMERLKQDAVTRAIPVHFVSGVDDPQRGLALGAVGYLVKPASHADLARVVRRLVPAKPAGQSVLIVEDDEAQGGAVLAVVERAGFRGLHVRTAAGAQEALTTGEFGCVVLDLGLPDMDGLGLIQSMRKRPELGSPRIVIHTGRSLSKHEARELEAYAAAIVLKDGSSAERLLEEVRLFVRHVTAKEGDGAQSVKATKPDTSLRGIKLLLAEDDMRTAYSLSALLRGKGAEVVTAETGVEALAALANHPDIRGVLMDVMMPEMDGYEAMRRLRREARNASLPVIALTAKAMKGERERCLEAGASEYLSKPIDSEHLLSTLQHWLGAGSS